ncbi:hypothetical protein [Ornithinimicrobium cryptoxanthini]|uniref:hypothetical protein n=1 Tax=Ornithinimicrobium cryptoxanthini TaxID=2934161 RepID=UPI00211852CB|nr:hypothetical protein [Ornithinimicrobium cryptoxanthini]
MSGAQRRAILAMVAALMLTGCQSQQVAVTGTADRDRIEAYEAMSETALVETEDLWGDGSVQLPVSVVLPATPEEFEELTGGAASSRDAPAVTVGAMAKAHVVVHPDSWDLLTAEGRQAVLTHEVTHLSMQGDGPVPPWLGEGLAEYTAHRSSALAPATIAGSALDRVRAGELPTTWPTLASQVGPVRSRTNTWGSYAMSWLACLYVADAWSERDLLELYEQVAGGTRVEDAIPAVLGVSEAEAISGWQVWLRAMVAAE